MTTWPAAENAQSFPHFIVHVTDRADANPDKAHLLRDIDPHRPESTHTGSSIAEYVNRQPAAERQPG